MKDKSDTSKKIADVGDLAKKYFCIFLHQTFENNVTKKNEIHNKNKNNKNNGNKKINREIRGR